MIKIREAQNSWSEGEDKWRRIKWIKMYGSIWSWKNNVQKKHNRTEKNILPWRKVLKDIYESWRSIKKAFFPQNIEHLSKTLCIFWISCRSINERKCYFWIQKINFLSECKRLKKLQICEAVIFLYFGLSHFNSFSCFMFPAFFINYIYNYLQLFPQR